MASRGTVVATTAAVAGLVGIALGWRLSSSSSRKQRAPAFRDDDAWIALAWQQLIHRKLPPQQSNFRVVAVVAFVRSTHGPIEYVVGHNDESCSLTNSCCGERAAFLQLAALKGPEAAVVAVYIVTDLGVACTPGCLCREYMSSSELTRPDVPIIMEGRDGPHTRSVIELGDFWPHASPYTGLDAPAQVALGERISPLVRHAGGPCHPGTLDTPKAQRAMAPETWETAVFKCHATAVSAARGDARDDLHPIRMGSAVVFSDSSCASAHQKKALEYGCSLDAVGQLAPALDQASNEPGRVPIVVCMADQYGVCHAPHGPGRAYLIEHGFGDVAVLCHDPEGRLHAPAASELVPGIPAWQGST